MLRIRYVFFCICFLFLCSVLCFGYDISGRELAQKVHDRYVGDNSKAEIYMILVNKTGYKRKRKFINIFMEKDKIRKNFIRFIEPEEIAGTGFLSIEKKDGTTIQYLYLPSLRRSRRIATSQKGSSFVNSDFTYEDMERRNVDDFDHKIVGLDKVGNFTCFVLESYPKPNTKTKYSLIRSYIPQNIYLSVKTEFYNKNRELFKILLIEDLRKIQGIWTPIKMVMKNLKRGHMTILKVENISYNVSEISDEIFTKQNLENW